MKKVFPLFLFYFFPGCALLDNTGPHTTVKVSPINKTITFSDTKDNRLEIKGLKAKTKDGGEFGAELILIENNASSVIREQQVMMDKYNEQMKTANAGLSALADKLNELAKIVLPGGISPNGSLTPLPVPASVPTVPRSMLPSFSDDSDEPRQQS